MIIQRFEQQVKNNPDKVAIKTGRGSFTYSELNRYANRIAHGIIEKWPISAKNNRVGLFLEDAFDMIAAMIGTLKAGKTYIPLSTDYPGERLYYMISHSEIPVILTDTTHKHTAKELVLLNHVFILEIEKSRNPVPGFYENFQCSHHPDNDLMYILYTSGSTGKPKGVMQNRDSVLHFIDRYTENLSITGNDHMTFFSSFSHDASVMDVYGALLNGAVLFPLNIMELPDLYSLSLWLTKEQITIWHSVPTVYRYFINALKMNGKKEFPHLRFIVLGGEAVIKYDIDMFHEQFPSPHITLYNLYGQTESSYNSGMFINHQNPVTQMTLGQVVKGTKIFVIDPYGNAADTLETGEIILASPYLSPGYLNDEEETKKSFREHQKFGKLYRTGDLGRLLPDGSIEFIGRKDSQVKIRGFRVELGEIETLLLKYDGIDEAVVVAKENENSDKYLCAYIVPDRTHHAGRTAHGGEAPAVPGTELRDFLSRNLPDYMIPIYFVGLEQMPLTPSGKINRKALPEPEAEIDAGYAAPRDAVEEKLVEIWANLLGIEKDRIGIDASFFELGGHSLKATIMAARVHKELNVELPLADIFKTPFIRGLSEKIKKQAKVKYAAIEPIEKKEFYPVSSAQNRLYVLQHMDEENTRFNISIVLRLEGPIEKERVEKTFTKLIQRHESFRTSFEIMGKPVQRIHDTIEFPMEYYDLSNKEEGLEEKRIVKHFLRPFDLSQAPLVRVGMIRLAQENHILMVDMHHIISDGTSLQVAVREFIAFYAGEELPPLRIQYRDFSAWQKDLIESGAVKKQEEYWLNRFKGDIPVLNMPLDYPRPPVYDAYGNCFYFSIDKDTTTALKQLALEMEMTVYIVLLAAYTVLLSKYSGQEDIVVGTPAAGRRHADLGNIIGLFANMMAMRNQPRGEKPFSQFLEDVKKNALEAYENQEYPFEQLVWNLNIKAEGSRHPLFDVVFVLQNTVADQVLINSKNQETLNKIKILPYDYEVENVHHELLLTVEEGSDTLSMSLQYAVELYKESTARNLSKHYVEILEQIAANRDITLKEIKISHDFITAGSDIVQDDAEDFRL